MVAYEVNNLPHDALVAVQGSNPQTLVDSIYLFRLSTASNMSESSASHRLNDVQDVQDLARRQEESKSPSVSVLLIVTLLRVWGGTQSFKIRIPGNGRLNSGFNVTVKTFPRTIPGYRFDATLEFHLILRCEYKLTLSYR